MDKDHRLDAPDNDSLQSIEQLPDRSDLSTIYEHGRTELTKDGLVNRDEVIQKQDEERAKIRTSIRKSFLVIGLLIPLPFVMIANIVTIALTYAMDEDSRLLLIPVILAIVLSLYIAARAFKEVYEIFYDHAMKATPFVFTHLVLLGTSLYATLLGTQQFHNGNLIHDVLIISGAMTLLSVLYSGLLLLIWVASRLSSSAKMACVALLVLFNGLMTALQMYFI